MYALGIHLADKTCFDVIVEEYFQAEAEDHFQGSWRTEHRLGFLQRKMDQQRVFQ